MIGLDIPDGRKSWTPSNYGMNSCLPEPLCSWPRSSSREFKIRVPFFLSSILVGEPSQPKKLGEKGHWGT